MYSHHFGLTQDPFSIAPDPRYLFMSERHREALAHLLYGVGGTDRVAGGGFVLLTGDIGTGKTTICRCFLEQIPTDCHVAYIFNPKLTVTELLHSICEEFHVPVAAPAMAAPTLKNFIDALNIFLLQSHAAGQSCVLIIDEAQNLQAEVLEQLRLLTNLETNDRKLLQIVLIGQPELRAMLARPELEQLAQRVIARYHLKSLSDTESTHYITHRLAVAGHKGALPFDARALQRIHHLTGGVPRRINLLCGRALLGAWANGLHRVDRAVVNQAAAEVFGADMAEKKWVGIRRTPFALGSLILVAGVALGAFMLANGPARAPPPAPAALPLVPTPTATASQNAPSAPQPVNLPPAKVAVEELETLLPLLALDQREAWHALGLSWKLPAQGGDPCAPVTPQTLQCYRGRDLTVPQLRRLGRPGILTLHNDDAPPLYAVLTGLTEETATVRLGSTPHTISVAALGRLWHGDFATYWQPPSGYVPGIPDGLAKSSLDTLNRQLAQFEGLTATARPPAPALLDTALRDRVRAFQRAQGLKADGYPGPMTFMQLESATAVMVPRLQTELR